MTLKYAHLAPGYFDWGAGENPGMGRKMDLENRFKFSSIENLVPRAGLEPARPFNRIPGF